MKGIEDILDYFQTYIVIQERMQKGRPKLRTAAVYASSDMEAAYEFRQKFGVATETPLMVARVRECRGVVGTTLHRWADDAGGDRYRNELFLNATKVPSS